jgi:Fe2+ or Zn2+ uptake regulation protein
MTSQRRVILEEVKKLGSHPTADQIYERVRKRLSKISMGTVYRNLDILAASGHIRKLEPAQTQMRFEGKTQEHYHITCIHCGRIDDAPGEPLHDSLENMENALGNLTKFGIFGHKLEFIGVCEACREAGKAFPVEDAGSDTHQSEPH